jgi:hypothetical protein
MMFPIDERYTSACYRNQHQRKWTVSVRRLQDLCADHLADHIEQIKDFTSISFILVYHLLKSICERTHLSITLIRRISESYPIEQASSTFQSIKAEGYSLNRKHIELFASHDFYQKGYFINCGLEDHMITPFMMCHRLVQLSVSRNFLTDNAVIYLTRAVRLGKGLEALQKLDISYNPGISDKSLEHMWVFSKLTHLYVNGTSMTEEGKYQLLIQKGRYRRIAIHEEQLPTTCDSDRKFYRSSKDKIY